MDTFTALAKIYSTKYFCNAKVSGLGEIFVKQKFSRIQYAVSLVLKWGTTMIREPAMHRKDG